jgi:serine protease Do
MSFVGINDLTDTIERLSNGIAPPFMGIYGQELTDDIIDSTQAPVTNGIYVQEITGNSPAYNCGVRSGDIIVKMSDADIYTLQDYMTALRKLDVGDVMTLVVYRPESEGYQEYKINVVLEEAEETR